MSTATISTVATEADVDMGLEPTSLFNYTSKAFAVQLRSYAKEKCRISMTMKDANVLSSANSKVEYTAILTRNLSALYNAKYGRFDGAPNSLYKFMPTFNGLRSNSHEKVIMYHFFCSVGADRKIVNWNEFFEKRQDMIMWSLEEVKCYTKFEVGVLQRQTGFLGAISEPCTFLRVFNRDITYSKDGISITDAVTPFEKLVHCGQAFTKFSSVMKILDAAVVSEGYTSCNYQHASIMRDSHDFNSNVFTYGLLVQFDELEHRKHPVQPNTPGHAVPNLSHLQLGVIRNRVNEIDKDSGRPIRKRSRSR